MKLIRSVLNTISAEHYEQFAEADRLEAAIKRNLEVLGFGE